MRYATYRLGLLCGLLALVLAWQSGCAIPRHIWKQDDIATATLNDASSDDRVLIASGKSDFKQAVIERLKDRYTEGSIFVRFVGLSSLRDEQANDYDAVVIMTSCVAWGIDPRAQDFLKRYKDADNVIVLVTSGDGGWLPDTKGKLYDAISSASKQTRVAEVADEIAAKVDALLENH